MTSEPIVNASEAEAEDIDETRAVARNSLLARWLAQSGTWVLLLDIVLVIAFTLISTDQVFWSVANFKSLMLNGTETLLLALGLGLFLAGGAVDLSVGANLVLSSVIGAEVLRQLAGSSTGNVAGAIIVTLLACLLVGAVYGAVNGGIIAYFRVNSLIATLGTLGIGSGIALLITGGTDIGGLPPELQDSIGLKSLIGVPVPALVALLLAAGLWWFMRSTRFGLRTLGLGSQRLAAERAGVRVRRHLLLLAIVTGLFCGLAGFFDISHYGATTVSGHTNDSLAALTAVVIGGTRLEGGTISIAGIIWGTGLSVLLQGGLVVIGVQPFWQLIAVGAVLIAAVCIDRLRTYRRRSRT